MANFETLNILFTADATQLKKEVDDVKKKTHEYTDESKKSEEQTKKTDNEFSNLARSLTKVAGAYFSVGAVVSGFRSAFDNVNSLSKLSRDFGINVESIDAWRKVVKNAGGDAEAFQSQLLAFAQAWNLDPNVALRSLPAIADKLKSTFTSIAQAQSYGPSAALGPEIISFLYNSEGGKAIESDIATQIKNGVISPEDLEATKKFNAETSKLSNSFDELFRTVSTDVTPALSKFAEKLGVGVVNSTPVIDFSLKSLISAIPFLGASMEKDKELIEPLSLKESSYVPTTIAPVSNSQAFSISMGNIDINTTAQDAKGIATSIMSEINTQGNTLLAQLKQSNAYFDGPVVI